MKKKNNQYFNVKKQFTKGMRLIKSTMKNNQRSYN